MSVALLNRISTLSPEQRELLTKRVQQRLDDSRKDIIRQPRTSKQFPLSFAQERLWFIQQLGVADTLYNIGVSVRVAGNFQPDLFDQSVQLLIRRHEALRTTFATRNGEPVQIINPPRPLSIEQYDLRHIPAERQTVAWQQQVQDIYNAPFDLEEGPLLRTAVLQLDDQSFITTLVVHHIVSDGISTVLLLNELWRCYGQLAAGRAVALAPLPIQHVDYAVWQRQLLQGDMRQAQVDYWQRQLRQPLPGLALPTDRPRPTMQSYNGAAYSLRLPPKLMQKTAVFCQAHNITTFQLLLATYGLLLHRHTNQDDIIIGTAIANRNLPELQNIVGFLVNNLALRLDLAQNPTVADYVQRVRQTTLEAYANQDIPFEQLVDALQLERDNSRSPLFQVAFALQEDVLSLQQVAGLELELLKIHSGSAKFDVTLELYKREETLDGWIEYNTDLFDEATIARFAHQFTTLLQAIVAQPEARLAALPVLNAAEQQTVVHDFNQTQIPFAADSTAHALFATQADCTPHAIALEGVTGEQLTYRELDQRANQLAHYLLRQNVQPDTAVGVVMERSIHMIVSLLGIMKAGAVYVPIDPTQAEQRLKFMLEDSAVAWVLTQQSLAGKLAAMTTAQPLCVDTMWPTIANEPTQRPAVPLTPHNLAYIIYTSGSTGKPKGTMLTHHGLCNLSAVQRQAFGQKVGSRVVQFSNQSFDASVWEIFMALLSGATLCLCDSEILKLGGDTIYRMLQEKQITTATLPPSVLTNMPGQDLPALQTLISAGEACTAELVATWGKGRRFFNAYGPTETSVCATMQLCDPNNDNNPDIGTPIGNFQIYILDKYGSPAPIGVPGELHIGGNGLARGYLNRPALTAEKFVPHPFGQQPGARLYRSGDLACWTPHGTIQFLGRIDHQVKIRGFRIELGEIEATIRQHPAVRETLVIAAQDALAGSKLVAYVVAESEATLSVRQLRRHLQQYLPDYMIPANFIPLPAFPLTHSGKIDRRKLPAPTAQRVVVESEYVKPENDAQALIAATWQTFLQVGRVGINDNFFHLGGHSLLMVKIHEQLEAKLERPIPIVALFQYPTVHTLADYLSNEQQPGEAVTAAQKRANKQKQARWARSGR